MAKYYNHLKHPIHLENIHFLQDFKQKHVLKVKDSQKFIVFLENLFLK